MREKSYLERETHVGVELANEAREIVVLEVLREQVSGEFSGPPDDEGRSVLVPGNQLIDGRIINKLISFCEKRSWERSLRVSYPSSS